MHNMEELQPPTATEVTPTPTQTPTPTPLATPPITPEAPITPPQQPETVIYSQPVVSGADPTPVLGNAKPRMTKRKRLLLIGAPLIVLLLAGGAVFGLYLPNTPGNVWNTALNRTGKALDTIVTSATETKQLESYKTSQVTGNITATFGDNTYSGDLTSKYDDTNSDSGINITLKSSDGTKKIGAQLLTQSAAGSVYPNLYFKISGLKDLGVEDLAPGLTTYDNRWIFASSDYLKGLGASLSEGDEKKQSPVTAADTAEVARSVTKVTREYVFSTASDKGVFVKKRFVAKETVDGISAYHYKVGVNTAHATAYCEAVSATVINSKVYKKMTGADDAQIAKSKAESKTSCASNTKDNLKSGDEYDLWVDGKYKLIHKIRQYDKDSTTEYTELGQNYKGNDEISLFLNHINTKDGSSSKTTLGTNLKTNMTNASFAYTNGDKTNPISVKATMTMKPLTGKLQTTKPTDSIQLQDVLDQLGFGDITASANATSTTGGVQERAKDSERKADVNALQTEVEMYWAGNNGTYPTLANINNTGWRTTNMPDIDTTMFTDPDSTSATLASAPAKNAYSYQPTNCDASGCKSYTLTATLSDGSLYKKTALD
jgi:hypothetical protein